MPNPMLILARHATPECGTAGARAGCPMPTARLPVQIRLGKEDCRWGA